MLQAFSLSITNQLDLFLTVKIFTVCLVTHHNKKYGQNLSIIGSQVNNLLHCESKKNPSKLCYVNFNI